MEKLVQKKLQINEQGRPLQDPRYIGLIINSIVHGVNNIIGMIRGYTELSLGDIDPDSQIYPYQKNIVEGTELMQELMEKMRIFGKQEKQDLHLIQIHSFVEDAINIFRSSLTTPVEIHQDIDKTCGAVLADSDQIRQTVINLCSNAYDAISENGGTFKIILKAVDVGVSCEGEYQHLSEGKYVKLTVSDTGCGMDQETLKQIYEPFFTTKKASENSGLGLSIVREIVKGHQGKMVVESQPGKGTAIDIYLPYASKNKGESMTRILVLDDELEVRKLLQETFSAKGYEVKTVSTSEHALDLISKESFDCILLDISLAGESGITVLKKIRKNNVVIPIVIYSGFITAELEIEARINGANEVLRKDAGVVPLMEQIDKIIKSKDLIAQDLSSVDKKSILIVDDDEEIRNLLKIFFKNKGYRLIEAKNGKEALQLAQSENFSVVLLDINMPKMDGLTTLKKLLEINSKLGVIMVTGNQDDENVKKAIKLGAYGYILKPFDFTYLNIVVMSKLKIAEND